VWRTRLLFRAGAVTCIAGGIGHFGLVDMLTLHGRTRVSEFIPHADILDTMQNTALSFGLLGSTTVFLAFAGFSLWVALSLVFFGLAYLMLSGQKGVVLRPFTRLGVIFSVTFCALAATCFIFPPALGAALATAFFQASWIKNES
jgi:hypothetical protein